MKPLLLISLIFFFFSVSALSQNYDNIASPGTTFFNNGGEWLKGYKYYSASTIGNDSVFRAPRTILRNPDLFECSDSNNGPVLPMMIRKKTDGWFVFTDRNTDSIRIKSNSSLNETWTVKPLPQNRRIDASVTAISQISFLSVTDSVKEITFTAKNQDGTEFPHIINGVSVLLSKHYGFIRTIDWNLFPDDTISWMLEGKDSPPVGIQDFSPAECFDFDPGDEFHFEYMAGTTGNSHMTRLTIKKILEKQSFGNDSVRYLVDVCSATYLPQPPPNVIYDWSTLYESVDFHDPLFSDNFSRIPDEMHAFYSDPLYTSTASRYYKSEAGFNGRSSKGYSYRDYSLNSGCWTEFAPEELYFKNEYALGLGETYEYYSYGGYSYHQNILKYYKKGSEEWGTPVSSSCNVLVSAEEKPSLTKISVKVFPDPVITTAVVRVDGASSASHTILLYDLRGTLKLQEHFKGNSYMLDRSQILSGFYFIRITDSYGKEEGTSKVIFE